MSNDQTMESLNNIANGISFLKEKGETGRELSSADEAALKGAEACYAMAQALLTPNVGLNDVRKAGINAAIASAEAFLSKVWKASSKPKVISGVPKAGPPISLRKDRVALFQSRTTGRIYYSDGSVYFNGFNGDRITFSCIPRIKKGDRYTFYDSTWDSRENGVRANSSGSLEALVDYPVLGQPLHPKTVVLRSRFNESSRVCFVDGTFSGREVWADGPTYLRNSTLVAGRRYIADTSSGRYIEHADSEWVAEIDWPIVPPGRKAILRMLSGWPIILDNGHRLYADNVVVSSASPWPSALRSLHIQAGNRYQLDGLRNEHGALFPDPDGIWYAITDYVAPEQQTALPVVDRNTHLWPPLFQTSGDTLLYLDGSADKSHVIPGPLSAWKDALCAANISRSSFYKYVFADGKGTFVSDPNGEYCADRSYIGRAGELPVIVRLASKHASFADGGSTNGNANTPIFVASVKASELKAGERYRFDRHSGVGPLKRLDPSNCIGATHAALRDKPAAVSALPDEYRGKEILRSRTGVFTFSDGSQYKPDTDVFTPGSFFADVWRNAALRVPLVKGKLYSEYTLQEDPTGVHTALVDRARAVLAPMGDDGVVIYEDGDSNTTPKGLRNDNFIEACACSAFEEGKRYEFCFEQSRFLLSNNGAYKALVTRPGQPAGSTDYTTWVTTLFTSSLGLPRRVTDGTIFDFKVKDNGVTAVLFQPQRQPTTWRCELRNGPITYACYNTKQLTSLLDEIKV